MERQVAAGLVIVALLAALAAVGVGAWLPGRSERDDGGTAIVDALAENVQKETFAASTLQTFVDAGVIHSATLYGPNGGVIATSGTAVPEAEQIIRSLPNGGSLSVQPRVQTEAAARRELLKTATLAAASAVVLALLASLLMSRLIERRVERLRTRVEESMRDQTYATRLPGESGALQPLAAGVNLLLDHMQQRDVVLRRKTLELESANKELESFAATVSHDLRAPVGSIAGFAQALKEDYAPLLDDTGRECVQWIQFSAEQMSKMIEGMLQMARLARFDVHRTDVDLSQIAREIAERLRLSNPDRDVQFVIPDRIVANGDERLLHAVLDNLIGNAFKFTSKRPGARIELGSRTDDGTPAFYVRDNGAGFDPEHASKMFRPFQRLHSESEFSGTGIGLATVHRIVQRHGGRVWAEGEPEKGATVYFTTGSREEWAA
ncbi:MAG TPA: ATP-binding protein [Thermoanaerobaculia bacterium]|nr:ATP-binding protein [Thermoanaerobaculia bacterium]